ncbi:hypothetical protein FJZ31_39420, partial [Candidatus Poribacteria bacterium]|nr:hypothetical protein [Candidatus Poribacteria bacterium]
MQFKQKLAYFALGCAFVVAGQVLSATIIPQVTSHWEASLPFSGLMLIVGIPLFGALFKKTTTRGNNKSPEFDTVTCRSLRVVDASGKEVARLELTKRDNVNDVIQVFNSAGVSAYRVGVSPYGGSVGVLDKDGKPCIGMGVGPNGGGVRVSDGDNKAIVMMNITDTGGGLAVSDKTGKGVIAIGAEENGGMISVTSNDSRAGFSNLQFPYRSERRLDGGFRLIGVANRKAIFQRKPLMAVCFEALK